MEKRSGSILVVDDNSSWRKLLYEVLTDDGHDVKKASNLKEAIKLLGIDMFDLAILDMRLVDELQNNIDGMKVLKEAKSKQPNIKAIILTGYPDSEHKEKALSFYNADGYFEKVPQGTSLDINVFSKLIFDLLGN